MQSPFTPGESESEVCRHPDPWSCGANLSRTLNVYWCSACGAIAEAKSITSSVAWMRPGRTKRRLATDIPEAEDSVRLHEAEMRHFVMRKLADDDTTSDDELIRNLQTTSANLLILLCRRGFIDPNELDSIVGGITVDATPPTQNPQS